MAGAGAMRRDRYVWNNRNISYRNARLSVSISAFWQLLQDSRLLAPEQCRQLAADFAQVKGAADQGSAKTLAEWLVARNVLSKYQTTILLAGRAGPFQYADYKVYDRVEKGRLEGQFRAVHGPTGHPVMLAFLSGPMLADARQWALAASNMLAAAAIVSPHLQRFFEPVDLQVFKFVVSEDLRGQTLDERLAGSRFPPAEACRIARQAAIGLAQMHQGGRVHGDVRPTNILLESVPGLPASAKLLWEAHQLPATLNFGQQPASDRLAAMADFAAPELMTPGYPPDALTDIYALGCTLYAMLSGSPPFAGGTAEQKLKRHATEPIRPLEPLGVPQPLAQLVAFMMAKNPAVRYQAAALVAEQLAAFVEPAALHARPFSAPPTLASYENSLRQRHAPAPSEAEAAFPRIGPRKVAFDFGQVAAEAPPALGPPGFAPPGPQPASPAPGSLQIDRDAPPAVAPAKVSTAAFRQQQAARNKRRQIAAAAGVLALCLAVAVGSFVALQNLGEFNKGPDDNNVAVVDPPEASTEGPDGGADAKSPAVTPASSGTSAQKPTDTAGTLPTGSPPAVGTPTLAPAGDGSFQQEIVADDSKLLWASPTTGKPVSFRCVPPEGQIFLIARPADLVASAEGEKVLEALGPTFAAQRAAFEKAAGFALADIERLIITLHANGGNFPRASFVVTTKEPLPPEQLVTRWGNPAAAQEGTDKYYTAGPWAYYVSTSPDDLRTFVMGEARDVKEVIKAKGNPPVLFREVERLRRTTDAGRHFTVLAVPQFLAGPDAAPLFAAERAKIRQPLAWLLGDGLQAVSLSMHFGSEFYAEARMLGSLDKEPPIVVAEMKSRLSQAPTAIENYLVEFNAPAYWKKLSFRYPQMLGQLQANLRTGIENDQAVVNSVLPGIAAHNLVLGGELLISSASGGGATVATTNQAPAKTVPKSLEDALQLKSSFSFAQQSLEFAMRDLAADVQGQLAGSGVEFSIKIIGGDLEKDGITRNQSVRDFNQSDKTIAEILTALVMKANPVTTVKDPSETDQKLVWLIGPDPDGAGKQVVLITTRTAAATNKHTLPAPFVPKEEEKSKAKSKANR